jgi:hypothetical protein
MKTVKIDNDLSIIYKPIPPLAVSAIQTNYSKKNPKPVKPTYEFSAVGGVTVQQEHDETTVSTEEEKAAWAKYKADETVWQTGLTEKLMLLFLCEGLEIKVSAKRKKQWDKRLERYYDLEDLDEDDLQLLYLQTFVFKTTQELEKATKVIMGLTGVSEEDLEAAENLF